MHYNLINFLMRGKLNVFTKMLDLKPNFKVSEWNKWKEYSRLTINELKELALGSPEEKSLIERFINVYGERDSYHNAIGMYSSEKITTHLSSNQIQWNYFCDETVELLSQAFKAVMGNPTTFNFEDLLNFLGERRNKIAHELNHGAKGKETNLYGKVRTVANQDDLRIYEDNIGEEVADAGTTWQELAPAIFKEIQENLSYYRRDSSTLLFGNYIYSYGIPNPHNVQAYIKFRKQLNLENPSQKNITEYFRIEVHIDSTEKINKAEFIYPPPFLTKSAYPYITKLILQALQSTDKKKFFNLIGEISYYCYRLLPWRLGTAGLTDLLVRGLARCKSIELGKRKEEELPIDWKAFLTPTADQFVKWFIKDSYLLSEESKLEIEGHKPNDPQGCRLL